MSNKSPIAGFWIISIFIIFISIGVFVFGYTKFSKKWLDKSFVCYKHCGENRENNPWRYLRIPDPKLITKSVLRLSPNYTKSHVIKGVLILATGDNNLTVTNTIGFNAHVVPDWTDTLWTDLRLFLQSKYLSSIFSKDTGITSGTTLIENPKIRGMKKEEIKSKTMTQNGVEYYDPSSKNYQGLTNTPTNFEFTLVPNGMTTHTSFQTKEVDITISRDTEIPLMLSGGDHIVPLLPVISTSDAGVITGLVAITDLQGGDFIIGTQHEPLYVQFYRSSTK